MNITEKKLENSTIELSISVPEDKVEAAYKGAFLKIQRSVTMDGFRKGKVPLQMIEANYKKLADDEAAEILINGSVFAAMTEKNLQPITQPSFSWDSITRGQPFSYTASFEVMPTVELGQYRDLDVDEKSTMVTDEDVESEINNLLEQHADVTPVTDTEAVLEDGNLAKALVKRIDDVDPAQRDSVQFREYPLVIGKSRDDFGLDKQIKSMKLGEEKEITVEYPSDYRLKDFAGQSVTYIVKIAGISTMVLPELNDEFAKKVGYESVEDLRVKTREILEKFAVDRARMEVRNNLLDRITGASTFDIPPSMIKQEINAVLKRRMQSMGIPPENLDEFFNQIMEHQDEMSEEMRESLREDAEKTIKNTLVLTEIARKEGLKVEDEKVRNVIQSISDKVGDTLENVEQRIQENGMRDNIEHELILDVTMEYLYNNAKVTRQSPIPFQDFMAEMR